MANLLDRLGELLKGLFSGGAGSSRGRTDTFGRSGGWQQDGHSPRDPDLEAAWRELDDYLRAGSEPPRGSGPGTRPAADESVRRDYANLEVPFGADIEDVRRSYKSLVLRYHPDRFAADPEKQAIALEITKKINESFERIRARS